MCVWTRRLLNRGSLPFVRADIVQVGLQEVPHAIPKLTLFEQAPPCEIDGHGRVLAIVLRPNEFDLLEVRRNGTIRW